MQNLEPILIFITVAEMGSFTRAADSLGIQKGRASTAVRKLEEDVGVRLLHRTTRSVQLTEDGRVFHARARDLLAEVDDLHSMFASDRVALRGRLYAGAEVKGAPHKEAAELWLSFIHSPQALSIFERYGFKPYTGKASTN